MEAENRGRTGLFEAEYSPELDFDTVESIPTHLPVESFTFNGFADICAVFVPSGFDHTVSYVDRDDSFAPACGDGATVGATAAGGVRSAFVPVFDAREPSTPGATC